MSLTSEIKEFAYRIGFDLVRITTAAPFPAEQAQIRARIAQGLFAGMDWFTAERAEVSCRPAALLPDARSVIALGLFYLTDAPIAETAEHLRETPAAPSRSAALAVSTPLPSEGRGAGGLGPRGRISRYAWGDDYHEIIRAKLDRLVAFLHERAPGAGETPAPPGTVATRLFVDTGRMVDRAVAQRAGLGWYGKNTNILTHGWGSWVFLSEVVTNLELEPDESLKTNCGTCEACLCACPTGAFIAPGVLDSRRCISYLTIEHRGSIPLELRPLIGNLIFGCDICQEVCPVNHRAEERLRRDGRWPEGRGRLEFQPRAAVGTSPALIPLLQLDEEGFRRLFAHSPIRRAKRRGLLRNVCVALGNIGDPVAIPALRDALRDPEPLVRGHAAWALGRIGGPAARAALDQARETETEASVCAELRCALAMME
jgi:epoxyqueuosine reductase